MNHSGNKTYSSEEADAVEKLVKSILDSNSRWIDRDGIEKPITSSDILIITPYNAQIFEIQQRLYGIGIGYRDISSHMEEIYGIEISKSLITAITDKILPKIKQWQNRPLEAIYPIIFLDAMHFKCTENGAVVSKAGKMF